MLVHVFANEPEHIELNKTGVALVPTVNNRSALQFEQLAGTAISHMLFESLSPTLPTTITWTVPQTSRGSRYPQHLGELVVSHH